MSGINDHFGQFGNGHELFPQDEIEDAVHVDVHEPHPDIYELFNYYTALYFEGRLDGVSVEWSSKRMTSCGGTCQSVPGGAIIKLSQPLLILRPSRDLKMVLLHEMIHAYCMVHKIRDPDPSGHGPPFQSIMNKINSSTVFDFHRPSNGYNISVYHTMFNEVEYYRQHHWKCERCGSEVHRAMNRKPQEADCSIVRKAAGGGGGGGVCSDTRCKWHMHLKHCGGEYVKIKEPEEYAQKNSKKKKQKIGSGQDGATESHGGGGGGGSSGLPTGQRAITSWLNPPASMPDSSAGTSTLPAINAVLQGNRGYTTNGTAEKSEKASQLPVSVEERRNLFEAAALRRAGKEAPAAAVEYQEPQDHKVEVIDLVDEDGDTPIAPLVRPQPPPREEPQQPPPSPALPAETRISCPICGAQFPADDNAALNSHLDGCLAL